MHFSKTYAKLLLDLPPELRENAIQYRQLKKLIHQVVVELSSLGLRPEVLHRLLVQDEKGTEASLQPTGASAHRPRVVYEFNSNSGKIEPRLRIWLTSPAASTDALVESDNSDAGLEESGTETELECVTTPTNENISLLWALQRNSAAQDWDEDSSQITEVSTDNDEINTHSGAVVSSDTQGTPREVIIPLVKDSAFFELLSTAIDGLSDRLSSLSADFAETLETVSRKISDSARPVSARKNQFKPHSALSHPGTISISSKSNASDLYSWREIFQLYIDSEVFESLQEAHAGEQSIEESEKRLKLFAERVSSRGLGDKRKLKLKQSHEALQSFLELNMFILNVKKLEQANADATRKILKKHAKRTALPLPFPNGQDYFTQALALAPRSKYASFPASSYPSSSLSPASSSLVASSSSPRTLPLPSLPRILIQALGDTLLPIIPHLDDYSCVICTNIAFKPIRLGCGHLFCVRCLVKMQKRRQGDCPMCRAPTVGRADGSNVDWALMNFMEDWFPVEAHEKLKASEKEATEEQLREMGFDTSQKCVIM
ncbi:SPX domain-containing protein [Rhodocollybia butyracea]|uniref:SPX domain-containing protein n=1 Tax=Rhodocollybia butyracea TaxID=206335 RepID=A0A9P5PTH2_9AGAR|nr:SPX domain-containing protein [Rhodocollybia butyracea]